MSCVAHINDLRCSLYLCRAHTLSVHAKAPKYVSLLYTSDNVCKNIKYMFGFSQAQYTVALRVCVLEIRMLHIYVKMKMCVGPFDNVCKNIENMFGFSQAQYTIDLRACILRIRVLYMYKHESICGSFRGDVGVGDRYSDCRFPLYTFSVSNPFLGSICTNKLPLRHAHQMVLDDMYYGNLIQVMLKQAPTSAACTRFLVIFDSGAKIFLFSWVSTPAPHGFLPS